MNVLTESSLPVAVPRTRSRSVVCENGRQEIVKKRRKITVIVPADLLDKAQRASGAGAGVTQTVRLGLQLVAVSRTYSRLRSLRGKVRFSRTWEQLKADG